MSIKGVSVMTMRAGIIINRLEKWLAASKEPNDRIIEISLREWDGTKYITVGEADEVAGYAVDAINSALEEAKERETRLLVTRS